MCTYGKAKFRRFQKSLNYNQMVFLHNYFPSIHVSGRQSNILLASRYYKKWNFNCIICRQPIGNPGMYVFNGTSSTTVKKIGFLVKTGLPLRIANEIIIFLKSLLPWPQTLMGLWIINQNPRDFMQVVALQYTWSQSGRFLHIRLGYLIFVSNDICHPKEISGLLEKQGIVRVSNKITQKT